MGLGWRILSLFLFIGAPSVHAASAASALRLQNSQYVSHSANFYRANAAQENSSLALTLRREKRLRKSFSAAIDLKDEYSASENWNYLNIHQAYLRAQVQDLTVHVGSRLETWSAAEEEWKQGVFQPRYMQNRLRPEMAGLSGLFFSSSFKSWLWTVGALPLFAPDLGAHFWVENHRFASRNPWFDPPAPSYKFRDQEAPITLRWRDGKPSRSWGIGL